MPAKSRAQWRMMKAISHGSIKRAGLTAKKASEYVSHQSQKGLPEKVPKRKFKYTPPKKK